jgi:hypothetical protein
VHLGLTDIGFDRFRFKLRPRELLCVAEDGSETPIPLGLRTTDVLLFFLERPPSGDEGRLRGFREKIELPTTAIKNLRTGGKIAIAARTRHKRGSAPHPSPIIHIHREYC